MDGTKKGWWLAGCGVLLVLLCMVSAVFWGFLVVQDSGGIDADEAAPGLLGSCCCALLSLAPVGFGVFVAVRAKRRAARGAPR